MTIPMAAMVRLGDDCKQGAALVGPSAAGCPPTPAFVAHLQATLNMIPAYT